MILAKAAEIMSLAVFGITYLGTTIAAAAPTGAVLEIGALGLCGFMITQNYRQRAGMARIIAHKDAEIRKAETRANTLAVKFTDAVNQLTATIAARPCVRAGEPNTRKPS